jgi:hypothetical protein
VVRVAAGGVSRHRAKIEVGAVAPMMILDCHTTAASRSGRLPELAKALAGEQQGGGSPDAIVPLAAQITEPDRAVLRHEYSPALAGWCG